MSFLGYILTEDGLTANPERIQPILSYKRPETVREVRSLVGLIGWYRRFLNKAAEKKAPLTDLIEKDNKRKIAWTAAAEKAFELIKHDLTHAPVLVPADYTLSFKLYIDASLIAGAGILTQIQVRSRKSDCISLGKIYKNTTKLQRYRARVPCRAQLRRKIQTIYRWSRIYCNN